MPGLSQARDETVPSPGAVRGQVRRVDGTFRGSRAGPADPGAPRHQGVGIRRGGAPVGGHGLEAGPRPLPLRGGLRPGLRGRAGADGRRRRHPGPSTRRPGELGPPVGRPPACPRRRRPVRRRALPPPVHGVVGATGRRHPPPLVPPGGRLHRTQRLGQDGDPGQSSQPADHRHGRLAHRGLRSRAPGPSRGTPRARPGHRPRRGPVPVARPASRNGTPCGPRSGPSSGYPTATSWC